MKNAVDFFLALVGDQARVQVAKNWLLRSIEKVLREYR